MKWFKNHYEVWKYPSFRLEVSVSLLHKFRNIYVFQTTVIRRTFIINCNTYVLFLFRLYETTYFWLCNKMAHIGSRSRVLFNTKRLCKRVSPFGNFCNTISISDYYQRHACLSVCQFFHLEKFDSGWKILMKFCNGIFITISWHI